MYWHTLDTEVCLNTINKIVLEFISIAQLMLTITLTNVSVKILTQNGVDTVID